MSGRLKKIVLHLLVWGVILSINLSLFGGYFGHDADMYELFFAVNAPIWLVYIILFYSNYLIFIPKLLFNSNIIAYLFCSITTLGLSYVVVQEFKHSTVSSKMQKDFPYMNRGRAVKVNRNTRDSVRVNVRYGKSPLLTSVEVSGDKNNRSNIVIFNPKTDIIIFEDVYRKVDTKRQLYGDIVYYINEDSGVRSVRRYHNDDIYNFSDPRNITQVYLLLLIFAVALVVGAIEKSVQRSRDVERISHEKTTSELSYLKQQINPHFLFNALNSIYSLVLPHSEPASDAVIKLSTILRYMLYETDKSQVSLEKEVEVMRDYLALQRLKFSDVTKVSFNIEGSLVGYTIEPLLLIPFIENAFKYGADNVTPSFVEINVTVDDGYFILSVRNRIVVTEVSRDSSGIGIKNIKRRLDLIYGDDYILDVVNESEIFSVKLNLKLL